MNSSSAHDQPYAQEGYAFMGAAFEVHNTIGGGLLEEIYQESLEIELALQSISFVSKPELTVVYKSRELKKRYTPDLIVFDRVVVELKSVSALCPEHEASAHKLHANFAQSRRLPRQLWADWKARVQAIHSV